MGEKVDFKRAYYIKLGERGKYEKSAISESKLRIGWSRQSLEDINSGDWVKIREQLSGRHSIEGSTTRDLNALRLICESTSEDLWITFSQGTMWWCKLGAREILQDNTSEYRLVDGKWSNQDLSCNILEVNNPPASWGAS